MDLNRSIEEGTRIGVRCLLDGRAPQAEAIFSRLLELVPEDPVLLNHLGTARMRNRDPLGARRCFLLATERMPLEAEFWSNLGAAALACRAPREGVLACSRAVALQPSHPSWVANLGAALSRTGETRAARDLLEHAVERFPDHAPLWCNLGTLRVEQADADGGEAAFRRAIALQPGYPLALFNLAKLRPDPTDPCLQPDPLALLAEATPLDLEDQALLHFTRAVVLDRTDQPALTAEAFARANQLVRRTFDYDPASFTRAVDTLIECTTPAILRCIADGIPGPIPARVRPIFIVGMPRSGTSLVEQILASHSLVFGAGELEALDEEVRGLDASGEAALIEERRLEDPSDALRMLATRYLDALTRDVPSSVRCVVDKAPLNFRHICWIVMLFPDARILHCMRNPLDTCVSIYQQRFSGMQPYAYEPRELGLYYSEYRRLMAHWHRTFPGRILDVRYEALVKDLEGETRLMLEHCGLEFEAGCLEFYRSKREVRTASLMQVRQPLYRNAVGRGERLRPFLPKLVEILDALQETGGSGGAAPLDRDKETGIEGG